METKVNEFYEAILSEISHLRDKIHWPPRLLKSELHDYYIIHFAVKDSYYTPLPVFSSKEAHSEDFDISERLPMIREGVEIAVRMSEHLNALR